MRNWWLGLLSLFLILLPANSPRYEHGYASAYAEGVMDATVRYRLDNDVWRVQPPVGWYTAHGYVAAMDCSRVGEMATMLAGGKAYRVLIADCAGDDGPIDRFSKRDIILEMDWGLWEELTGKHGKPLPVSLSR